MAQTTLHLLQLLSTPEFLAVVQLYTAGNFFLSKSQIVNLLRPAYRMLFPGQNRKQEQPIGDDLNLLTQQEWFVKINNTLQKPLKMSEPLYRGSGSSFPSVAECIDLLANYRQKHHKQIQQKPQDTSLFWMGKKLQGVSPHGKQVTYYSHAQGDGVPPVEAAIDWGWADEYGVDDMLAVTDILINHHLYEGEGFRFEQHKRKLTVNGVVTFFYIVRPWLTGQLMHDAIKRVQLDELASVEIW